MSMQDDATARRTVAACIPEADWRAVSTQTAVCAARPLPLRLAFLAALPVLRFSHAQKHFLQAD